MKKGFTLTELLMALTIVGVLAILTIPVMMNNVHNRVFANQVKNMAATIEQLAQDELIAHRTRDLSDTDFGDPEKLLSDKHFSIAKKCTSDESLTKCWKTNAEGKEKVTYKRLNKTAETPGAARTIILKNGVIVRYHLESHDGATVGVFLIDVNGNDKPNIVGRDYFGFYVTPKGHIIDEGDLHDNIDTVEKKVNACKTCVYYCYGALADNGWKMDY